MKTTKPYALLLGLSLVCAAALAEMAPDQLARLGKDLTPLGGEIAGNADGSIPAWTGGIRSVAEAGFPDFQSGGHHPDPFAAEKPLFEISAQNMAQYADRLTAGHRAMLAAYPSFSMKVYPSHRTAAFPQRIYDATKTAAASAKLTADGNGVTDAVIGTPFPLPKNGHEAIWNHMLRYHSDRSTRNTGQAPVLRNGDYTLVKMVDWMQSVYHDPAITAETLNNQLLLFKQNVMAPPRLAGSVLLVHETLNQNIEPRKAWVYNPGQRRVRRAPNVAFDNPGTASDGLRTSDQFDMYNGSPERYDWKLLGRQEVYVPYNAYRLHSRKLKYDDIIRPLHMNPEHLRYELHRAWVVEATLKEGTRHIYKRRTFYIDEDSWQILHVDQYDNRDQLWRVSEGHVINYYDVPTIWTTLEAHYDLQSGRYLLLGLNNEEAFTVDFVSEFSESDFSISALRREGRR